MRWNIPGTVLVADRETPDAVESLFSSMFLAGGMVLSQVSSVTGLEPYTIQNWVKRGFLTPPVKKKYSCRQLCRILNINMLKSALPMEKICGLLGYINGVLDDESDDTIDDSQLYFAFARLVSSCSIGQIGDGSQVDALMEKCLADYREPVPGAKDRVKEVLQVMLLAWGSSQLQAQAENAICALNI
ncbi:MAG: DUF1836 domain-containing protein [Faecousia sp.]